MIINDLDEISNFLCSINRLYEPKDLDRNFGDDCTKFFKKVCEIFFSLSDIRHKRYLITTLLSESLSFLFEKRYEVLSKNTRLSYSFCNLTMHFVNALEEKFLRKVLFNKEQIDIFLPLISDFFIHSTWLVFFEFSYILQDVLYDLDCGFDPYFAVGLSQEELYIRFSSSLHLYAIHAKGKLCSSSPLILLLFSALSDDYSVFDYDFEPRFMHNILKSDMTLLFDCLLQSKNGINLSDFINIKSEFGGYTANHLANLIGDQHLIKKLKEADVDEGINDDQCRKASDFLPVISEQKKKIFIEYRLILPGYTLKKSESYSIPDTMKSKVVLTCMYEHLNSLSLSIIEMG